MIRKNKNKQFLLITSVVILIAAVGSVLYYVASRNNGAATVSDIAPATEQEKIETEQNKDRIAAENQKRKEENTPQNGTQSADKKSGDVTVTFSGQYGDKIEVGAFVANVFEDGGSCEIIFGKDTLSLTKQSSAFKDVGHTSCTPFSISKSEFSQAGQWKFIVKYTSPTTSGQSTERTVDIK